MGNALFGPVLTRDEMIAQRRRQLKDAIQDLSLEITTMEANIGRLKEVLLSTSLRGEEATALNVAEDLKRNMERIVPLQKAQDTLRRADTDIDQLRQTAVLQRVVVDATYSLVSANRLSSLPTFRAFAATFKAEASVSHKLASSHAATDIGPKNSAVAADARTLRIEARKAKAERAQLQSLIDQVRQQAIKDSTEDDVCDMSKVPLPSRSNPVPLITAPVIGTDCPEYEPYILVQPGGSEMYQFISVDPGSSSYESDEQELRARFDRLRKHA